MQRDNAALCAFHLPQLQHRQRTVVEPSVGVGDAAAVAEVVVVVAVVVVAHHQSSPLFLAAAAVVAVAAAYCHQARHR